MANCGPDEKDITNDKLGAQFGTGVIVIIYIVFIVFIIGVILSVKASKDQPQQKTNVANTIGEVLKYVKSIGKGKISENTIYEDNFTGRFTEWFTRVGSSINSSSILAILAAGVVIGFNGLIMTPIISTMFPKDITQSMQIPGRMANVNPGQFFIALIGFIISLILFFFVAELIYLIRRKFKKSLTIIILVLLFIFLTFMLIWNGLELDRISKLPDCVPLDTNINSFQLRNYGNLNDLEQDLNQESENSLEPSLPPFGIFG